MNSSADTNTIAVKVIDDRIGALAAHLGCEIGDITSCRYDENTFEACGGEYLVLTDDEADDKAREYIEDTLWAFNASFIASHTRNGLSTECIKALEEMQGKLCESASPIFEALIEDMDLFVRDAIGADGRGHFLSQYDGEENEEGAFYIYRTN